ncbi:MAG: sulfatase [Pirellulaceae bacterium]|nr:sulfatase [Pirellulaceae bacterium]
MHHPNVVVMLMDNLGYGDLECYGSTQHRTPNIDRLALTGMRLTSFYSTSGVCTPSRASLMTGCYPRRVNMHVGGHGSCVLMPVDPKGIHPDELTLADLLRNQGYVTACVGKWHLGDQPEFLPTRHGFDEFFGCSYSEDMVATDLHPERPPLPLMRGETVIEAPADRDSLTKRYTEEGVQFIERNKNRPFFLYLSHAMPGSTDRPFSSPAFQGRSPNGPYGDAVEELDWSCGQIMETLTEHGLDENTLVIWSSDNGAVKWDPPQGSNAPLRGWGYDTSEGGQRMPSIVRWPGVVPARAVRDDVTTMMDIMPTAVQVAGGELPTDRTIDGHDIRAILLGDADAVSPYDEQGFFYYHMHQLQAVRSGQWKLYLPLANKIEDLRGDYDNGRSTTAELYDVRHDVGETRNVVAELPDVVALLTALADSARRDLGDWDREGSDQRPAGWVDDPTPQVLSSPN